MCVNYILPCVCYLDEKSKNEEMMELMSVKEGGGVNEEIKIGTAVAQQSRINLKQKTNTNVSVVEQW